VLAGVLALQQGFQTLYTDAGRPGVVVFLRPGAVSEGDSAFSREQVQILKKEVPEIARGPAGAPLASAEVYLAVRRKKRGGGETNVPIRGVEEASFAIAGAGLQVVKGRRFAPGADEVIVGESLVGRIEGCEVGGAVQLNTVRFLVVGVFRTSGPFGSEIWGSVDRIGAALQRRALSRVIARVRPGTDVEALAKRMENDKRVPAKVLSEKAYLAGQTRGLSVALFGLGAFLALVMGTAAVLTGTNTMLSAVQHRTHEIGILLAVGFRPVPVFLSFLVEAVVLGLLGGAVGVLLVLPLHGVKTGTTNFQTFTEVAFAFRVTPQVLFVATAFAMGLGLLGGLIPAWTAARQRPVDSLRQG